MKAKAMLRVGLLLLYTVFALCCKGSSESDTTIEKSSIVSYFGNDNQEDISENPETGAEAAKEVYICKSSGAKRYHYDKSCRGLKRCTHTIAKVSVKTAKGYGLSVCGYEK